MDESVVKHLEAEKVSSLIRRGIPLVRESNNWHGCALAAAYRAKTGRPFWTDYKEEKKIRDPFDFASKALGIPRQIVEAVSDLHFSTLTSEQCAGWLESKGY